MTTQTLMTMNDAQRGFIIAAVQCLLEVRAEAGNSGSHSSAIFCTQVMDDLSGVLCGASFGKPLSHQEGRELLDLLESCSIDLRLPEAPAASGIVPYYSDEPGGYAGQVPAEDEVWVVPCKLTIVGAETADAAAVMADTILGKAMADEVINADENLLTFEIEQAEADAAIVLERETAEEPEF